MPLGAVVKASAGQGGSRCCLFGTGGERRCGEGGPGRESA